MAVVYIAHDRVLRRDVIVKSLRTELRGSRTAERRFLREARINSQLHHPSIVPLYDIGRLPDGRPYLTMKIAEGRTLEAEAQCWPLTSRDRWPVLARIFEQLCDSLAYAHQRGVVHRDVKPLNVMVSPHGHVRVLDWGLAKFLSHDEVAEPLTLEQPAHETSHGATLGTPAFMPPEQARGLHHLVDMRADVFALGAVLCWMLTGQPPYVATTTNALWEQAQTGQLADAVARLRQGAPRSLANLAIRWLSPHPDDRPASAAVALAEWHRCQTNPSWWKHWLTRFRTSS
jgi:serine/threonine-protein kinase